MRNEPPKNPFSDEVRSLFLFETSCWKCGRSDVGLELDHIWGRKSNSAYNAFLICRICHTNKGTHDFRKWQSFKIKAFLKKEGYEKWI